MLSVIADKLHDNSLMAALLEADAVESGTRARVETLLDLSGSLQVRPRSVEELQDAVVLAEHARALAGAELPLLCARASLRIGTALKAMPGGTEELTAARDALETATRGLRAAHGPETEIADAEMNLGVVIQSLAGAGAARLADALACYQRALPVFTRDAHPAEYAMLQNNLATAYLAMPLVDERAQLREALAVQAFEEGLSVVTLVDHPTEYAMLQNNLGNALQAVTSSHPLDNLQRAVSAYDEALRVRNPRDTPLEYANTVANKASALSALPDDMAEPERPNTRNLATAIELLREAFTLFSDHGAPHQAEAVGMAIADTQQMLAAAHLSGGDEETTPVHVQGQGAVSS